MNFLAHEDNLSAVWLMYTENRLHYLSSPRADKTSEADDFPCFDVYVDIAEKSRPAQTFKPQQLLADFSLLLGVELVDVPSDHLMNQE